MLRDGASEMLQFPIDCATPQFRDKGARVQEDVDVRLYEIGVLRALLRTPTERAKRPGERIP
jgi:hypothetical protein